MLANISFGAMKKLRHWYMVICCLAGTQALAQTGPTATGPGIGFYPTGTETGIGYRSSKDKKLVLDIRATKANFFSKPGTSNFITECSLVYRVVYLEKVRLHTGLGYRADWNFTEGHKHGAVLPLGVEAFPFPFQNAGLFFECGFFADTGDHHNWHAGIRTAAGFIFYFPKRIKTNPESK
jgi:hypothetical protein